MIIFRTTQVCGKLCESNQKRTYGSFQTQNFVWQGLSFEFLPHNLFTKNLCAQNSTYGFLPNTPNTFFGSFQTIVCTMEGKVWLRYQHEISADFAALHCSRRAINGATFFYEFIHDHKSNYFDIDMKIRKHDFIVHFLSLKDLIPNNNFLYFNYLKQYDFTMVRSY